MPDKAPGSKWILILAGAGFAAGFFGPLVFVPDANQGPLVGLLISGPAGVLVGALLWGSCALLKLSAKIQWRMLSTVATLGVVAILLGVQPEPEIHGYVFDAEVESCSTPSEAEAEVLEHWNERIAEVTWANPRAGWQQDMRRLLSDAPGVVLSVRVLRKNAIKEHRKMWNRGHQFAAGWTDQQDEIAFYDASGSCDQYPDGGAIHGFQKSDYEQRLRSADIWPPEELLPVLGASPLSAVPEQWSRL